MNATTVWLGGPGWGGFASPSHVNAYPAAEYVVIPPAGVLGTQACEPAAHPVAINVRHRDDRPEFRAVGIAVGRQRPIGPAQGSQERETAFVSLGPGLGDRMAEQRHAAKRHREQAQVEGLIAGGVLAEDAVLVDQERELLTEALEGHEAVLITAGQRRNARSSCSSARFCIMPWFEANVKRPRFASSAP